MLVRARQVAESVPDPELPMLTLADLGILRDVTVDGGRVVVSLTPTYSGCPAIAEIRADLTVHTEEFWKTLLAQQWPVQAVSHCLYS